MSFEKIAFDRVYYIRWGSAPTKEDVAQLVVDMRAARRACGQPLFMLSVIPAAVRDTPSPEVRARVRERTAELLESCGSMDIVFEGDGVLHALLRTIVRGMLLVVRISNMAFMHDSVRAAVARIAAANGLDAAALAREIRAHGGVV